MNKCCILLLILFSWQIMNTKGQDKSLEKFSRENEMYFNPNEFSGIDINNQHGNINIYAGSRDSVKVKTEITVHEDNKTIAEEVLEMIEIGSSQKNGTIKLTTKFKEEFYTSNSFSINYEVHVPHDFSLKLKNRFGNIDVSSVTGNLNIDLEYGNFRQKSNGITDSITGKFYFATAKAGDFKTSIMELQNSQVEFNNITNHGSFKGKYFQLDIKSGGSLDIEAKTARFNAENINQLNLHGDFCFSSIGKISEKAQIEINNGMLIVHSVSNELKELRINNNNAPINLVLPESLAYTLHGEVSNGRFRHYMPGHFRIIRERDKVSFSGEIKTQQNGASIVLFNKDAGINIEK